MKSSFHRHHPNLAESPQLCPGLTWAGGREKIPPAALKASWLPGWSPLLPCVSALFSLAPTPGLRFMGREGRSHLAKEQPSLHFGSPLPARSPARTGFCFFGSQTQWKLSWFLCVQDLNILSSHYRRISLQTHGNTQSRLILTFWPSVLCFV